LIEDSYFRRVRNCKAVVILFVKVQCDLLHGGHKRLLLRWV